VSRQTAQHTQHIPCGPTRQTLSTGRPELSLGAAAMSPIATGPLEPKAVRQTNWPSEGRGTQIGPKNSHGILVLSVHLFIFSVLRSLFWFPR
jgi:hypothetical protein